MTADWTANGSPVLRGSLRLPGQGRWEAQLVLEADAAPSGAVTLDVAGVTSLRGTAHRTGGGTAGYPEVLVVGGAGGLQTPLAAKFYRGAPVRLALTDALREAGETLSSTCDPELLAQTLAPAWSRPKASCGRALDALAAALGPGVHWRVLFDGSVWIGRDVHQAVTFDHDLMDEAPNHARVTIATDALPADLVPGTAFLDRRVARVEHTLAPSSLRTTVTFQDGDDLGDPEHTALDLLVRHALPELDYHALYRARVVTQHDDGTLDVMPDDDRLPPMTEVPMRLFVPGADVRVLAGAVVLVGFENGDARAPIAELWASGTLDRLTINAATLIKLGAGATKAAVRTGDPVNRSTQLSTWMHNVEVALNALSHPVSVLVGETIGSPAAGSSLVEIAD